MIELTFDEAYFGAMLSRGATTFWEDFHMDWLEGSGRIDELPEEGQKIGHEYDEVRDCMLGWDITDYESDVTVHTDGRTYTVPTGTQIRLTLK